MRPPPARSLEPNEDDPRYINICVEQINYTPVSYDWLVAKARKAMA